MFSIVVGFPKREDAVAIRSLLIKNGYHVNEVCTTGAQIISQAHELDEGIVICGYRFADMHYSEIHNYLPKCFEMLMIASHGKLEFCQDNNIVCLPMPFKTNDLINTLNMITYRFQRRKKKSKEHVRDRSEEEKDIISKAKTLLMIRNNMTEEEAHRYLQKHSMDTGTNMIEMAEIVLRLFDS